jgi:hypothetical protein
MSWGEGKTAFKKGGVRFRIRIARANKSKKGTSIDVPFSSYRESSDIGLSIIFHTSRLI